MTTIQLARRAVRLYNCDMVPLLVNKHNRRAWLRSLQILGTRWIAHPANHVKRESNHER